MTDADALLAAVLANPDDDTPRLLYADALDEDAAERGEPIPCARAEFIRVQIELARIRAEYAQNGASTAPSAQRINGLAERERELLQGGREWDTAFWSKHLDEWIRGLPGQVPCLSRDEPAFTLGRGNTAVGPPVKYVFVRGFVELIEACPAADWLTYADAILAAHPVRKVALATWPGFGNREPAQPLSHNRADGTTEWKLAGRSIVLPTPSSMIEFFEARWHGVAFRRPGLG